MEKYIKLADAISPNKLCYDMDCDNCSFYVDDEEQNDCKLFDRIGKLPRFQFEEEQK